MTNYVNNGWYAPTCKEWEIKRMKNIMYPKNIKSTSGNEELLSVTIINGVEKRKDFLKDEEGASRSETLVGYKLVDKDDLVNNIMKMSFRCLGVSEYYGIVSPAYSVFSLDKCKILPKYLNLLLRTDIYVAEFRKLSKGIQESRMRLYDDYFLAMKVIVPPLKEQKIICEFLDKKVNKIDLIIEKIKNKLELLEEQKISLIHNLITKGLDPNAEMKDSGIEWIDYIPKHWELKKLKYFSEIIYGISPPENSYNDNGIGKVLINGPVEYSKEEFGETRSIKWTTKPTKIVSKGYLLFCLRGSVGRMNITHEEVCIGRGVCAIKSKFDQKFLIFSMMLIGIYLKGQLSGSLFPSVNKNDVDNFKIPFPDLEEQRDISSKLSKKIDKLEKLSGLHKKKLELLKEYKESIISKLVTGQIQITEDML